MKSGLCGSSARAKLSHGSCLTNRQGLVSAGEHQHSQCIQNHNLPLYVAGQAVFIFSSSVKLGEKKRLMLWWKEVKKVLTHLLFTRSAAWAYLKVNEPLSSSWEWVNWKERSGVNVCRACMCNCNIPPGFDLLNLSSVFMKEGNGSKNLLPDTSFARSMGNEAATSSELLCSWKLWRSAPLEWHFSQREQRRDHSVSEAEIVVTLMEL